jgi:acyl CoA:acetate/3-ketoacid CoA transferase beta subunit
LDEGELPLTGKGVVDMIITELAVFAVDREGKGNGGLTLLEVAEGVDVEEVRRKTRAKFEVAEDLKTWS